MNVQKSLSGFLPRYQSSSAAIRAGFIPLRQISISEQAAATRRFTSAACSTHFNSFSRVRVSCHKQLSAGQWAGRAVFSSGSSLRSAEGEDGKVADEAKEGTAPAGGKAAYPERLIIYHAGTGKTTFLACLKVTTLFVFGFFDMVMVPAYLAANEPLPITAGIALCGLIPALYVAWSTTPFVAAIHLHLPPYARYSRAILERFARTAPPNTRLDVTTMSLIGKPRVSSLTLSDLRPAAMVSSEEGMGWATRLRKRLGMVNYVRDTGIVEKGRKWWRFRAVSGFNILEQQQQGGAGAAAAGKGLKTGWVWGVVREGIERRAVTGVAGVGKGRGKL